MDTSEISLHQVWDEPGGLAGDIPTCAVAGHSPYVVFPHEPGDPMLAAGFASFPQVEKDARCAIHALAGLEQCPDQAQKSRILPGAI
jgi:hypothetical protein